MSVLRRVSRLTGPPSGRLRRRNRCRPSRCPRPPGSGQSLRSSTGAPRSLDGLLDHLADLGLAVDHEGLLQQHRLFVEFAHPAFDHLLDDVLGLAGLARDVGLDGALALHHVRATDARASAPAAWRRRHAWRSAWPAPSACPCRRWISAPPARRSCPVRARRHCGHRPRRRRDRRASAAARRTLMFSPILATSSVRVCCTVADAHRRGQQLLQVAAFLQRELGGVLHEGLELVVAGDEVGLGIDFDQRAGIAGRPRRRPGLRRRRGRPSWRPWRCPSCAASRWRLPCRRWSRSSAFLQSIMPAPVLSRRSFTMRGGDVRHVSSPFRSRARVARGRDS